MFKSRLILLLALSGIGLSACKSVHVSEFNTQSKGTSLLPAMHFMHDAATFESAFSRAVIQTQGNTNGILLPQQPLLFDTRSFSARTIQQNDRRFQDVITIFEREMHAGLFAELGEPKGTVLLKLPVVESRIYRWGLLVPHALTFGLASLTGLPFYHFETAMEVEVEVYDRENKLIKRYRGQGMHSEPIALYRYMATHLGDGQQSGVRITNMRAFRQALTAIHQHMQNDAADLAKLLAY
jgi:hypothetical protein